MFSPHLPVRRQSPALVASAHNDFLWPYTLQVRLEGSFLLYACHSIWLSWSRYLTNGGSTWHSAEGSQVGSEGNDMIIPIHKQKSIDESQSNAVAFHEVGAEGTKSDKLGHFGSSTHCTLHTIIYLYLQVEELGISSFCFGHAVEEIVQQEEVIVKVSE